MGNNANFDNLEITRDNLCVQIADKIKDMIGSKQLEPGAKLPSERKLAEKFGINRVTINKAILILEQKGLVKIKTGMGTYVTNVPSSIVTESIKSYYKFGNGSNKEIMDLREILEPEIAALAAINAEEAELKKLENQITIIRKVLDKKEEDNYILEDEIFHEILAEATHNELISAIVIGLRNVMLPFKKSIFSDTLYCYKYAIHANVFEAICARNSIAAKKAMTDDIKAVRSAIGL